MSRAKPGYWRTNELPEEENEPGPMSLSDYTPPPEGEEEFKFWIQLGILVFAAIIIVPFLVTSVIPAMATMEKRPLMIDASVQQPASDTIIVTYKGGQDTASLVGLSGTVTTAAGVAETTWTGSAVNKTPVPIGSTMKFSGDFTGQDHVVVTGYFADGREIAVIDITL